MNAGIQDGINLAWRLAAHLRLNVDASILAGYDVDRREMFERIAECSNLAHKMLIGRNAEALRENPELRSAAVMAAADRDVSEVSFIYGRDRMWRDEAATGTLRAGMRVPPTADFSCGQGSARLWFGIYDGFNWTVVITVPDRKAIRTAYIRQVDLDVDGTVAGGPFDLVLANLTGGLLIRLVDRLVAMTLRGGALILSGITTAEADDVIAAFEGAGCQILERRDEDGWVGLRLGW